MQCETSYITPFIFSRIKLNYKTVSEDKYGKNKQIRAFMPNLIHSLDASSLCLLYIRFSIQFENAQFFAIHDCFATTFDKVSALKTLLTPAYVDLSTDEHYLIKLDKDLINNLINKTDLKLDMKTRTIYLPNSEPYVIHGIN